ncbi:hypothetical protein E2C01_050904 [Portunus trituberculatus]|uniref:Secreted protein n=1 Tax=Portunus trituberculatus TaxID=210409 RepID=A0A5B7GH74_PORTR|nr:hypothetical protein [Portunus trituberculatus]
MWRCMGSPARLWVALCLSSCDPRQGGRYNQRYLAGIRQARQGHSSSSLTQPTQDTARTERAVGGGPQPQLVIAV